MTENPTEINAIDLTFESPFKNIAFEEALLDHAEDTNTQWLRFWESQTYFVVLGRGNKVTENCITENCTINAIPIIRRCSGGGTVLQGPGCLNYTLVLNTQSHPDLSQITSTNHFILNQNKVALSQLIPNLHVRGHSDLCSGTLKISGNAQRRKKTHLLFHGTFLYNFELGLISQYLCPPPLQPDYRNNRPHSQFVTNIPLKANDIQNALIKQWHASTATPIPDITVLTHHLMNEKYMKSEWNYNR